MDHKNKTGRKQNNPAQSIELDNVTQKNGVMIVYQTRSSVTIAEYGTGKGISFMALIRANATRAELHS